MISRKPEWILELKHSGDGVVRGSLRVDRGGIARAETYALDDVSYDSLMKSGLDSILEALDRQRNPHLGEESPPQEDLGPSMVKAGKMLGRAFLPATVCRELRNLPDEGLRLVVLSADPSVHRLPWELLILPGEADPLAIRPDLDLVRRVPSAKAFAGDGGRPPLRIAFTASVPDSQEGDHRSFLDHDLELQIIMEALEQGHSGRADSPPASHARVYESFSSQPRDIGKCLADFQVHVFHLSGHGREGNLILEDEKGQALEVTGERLFQDALKQGAPRLAVLSQCQSAAEGSSEGFRSAASELAAHVPIVVGMQWPVTHGGAIHLWRHLYRELEQGRTDPVALVCEGRREIWRRQKQSPGSSAASDWAAAALYCAPMADQPLYTTANEPFERPYGSIEATQGWEAVLPPGEFVGRRPWLRRLLVEIMPDGPRAAVLCGAGGIGKSSLTARLRRFLLDRGWEIRILMGLVTPQEIWAALDAALAEALDRLRGEEAPPGSHKREGLEKARGVIEDKKKARSPLDELFKVFLRHASPHLDLLLVLVPCLKSFASDIGKMES